MDYDKAIASLEALIQQLKVTRDQHIRSGTECEDYYRSIGEEPPAPEPLPMVFLCVRDSEGYRKLVDPVFELNSEPVSGLEIVEKPHKQHIDAYALILNPKE